MGLLIKIFDNLISIWKIATLAIFLFLSTPMFPCAKTFEGKVVGVSDGDTIKALKDGKQVKIRLAAIDRPEKDQPYGLKAKSLTVEIVAGKIVKICHNC